MTDRERQSAQWSGTYGFRALGVVVFAPEAVHFVPAELVRTRFGLRLGLYGKPRSVLLNWPIIDLSQRDHRALSTRSQRCHSGFLAVVNSMGSAVRHSRGS